jgi:sulfate/thiosulfate transport system ATP-binding protein
MSIHIERLTKRYEGNAIVNAVSLEVRTGELFVLLGPSGSGKSTLLRIIAGLATSDAGRVFLHGRDVTLLPPQSRDIGFVFQHYALFPHMSVAENVEFGLRVRRVDAAERQRRREELLEMVGLAGLGGRLPRQLSGGQQQRVALARALAVRPAVLLLDEPFGALDAKIRIEMRHSLRHIQRDLGITTIFVTHDQEEAFELGDRLGIMNAGRLLEVGPPDELYLRPETEFAASFLGSANILLGEATATGVRVGPIEFPLRTRADDTTEARRVQVLFRPEDVTLAPTQPALSGTSLGMAEVEERSFAGTYERLRLRLPRIAGVRSIAPVAPFGTSHFPLEATRSLEQGRQVPLQPGATVWVGVQRIHALLHPGLSVLIVTDGAPADQAIIIFGAELARLTHARLTIVGAGMSDAGLQERLQRVKQQLAALPVVHSHATADALGVALARQVESQPSDMVLFGQPRGGSLDVLGAALRMGEHHVLLLPPSHTSLPTSFLVCVAGNEPSKDDVLFAGRLARHLGAKTTLLSIVSDERDDSTQLERSERFLDASVRTLSQLGVEAHTQVRSGPVRETIEAEMIKGGHDLLVLGVPLRPLESARIRHFLTEAVTYPVLVVRSPTVGAGAAHPTADKASSVEEVVP